MGFVINEMRVKDLISIEPDLYGDDRGYFLESYNEKTLKKLGFFKEFVQDNESKSKKGVLRGLHFQTKQMQGKLVRCISGKILDVVIDLRIESATYGEWESVILDSEKKNMLYVPERFAHGFLVLSDEAIFGYKCTDYYAPEYEGGIKWDDQDLKIDWKFKEYGITEVFVSEKDTKLPWLRDINIEF